MKAITKAAKDSERLFEIIFFVQNLVRLKDAALVLAGSKGTVCVSATKPCASPRHPQLLQEGREVEEQSTLGKSRETFMNSRKPLAGEITDLSGQ